MSKDKILIVRFNKVPNTDICLLLLARRNGFAFVTSTSSRSEAEYLKYHIQDIGVKEYNQEIKSCGVSKKLLLKNVIKDIISSNRVEMAEGDDEDDALSV